jgi:hypothetical protein
VDQFGSLEDAIELAAKRVGMEEEPAVYYSRTEQEHWWERMMFGVFGRRLHRGEAAWLRYEWSPALLR